MLFKFYSKWKTILLGIFNIIANTESAIFAIIAGTLISFATRRSLDGFGKFCIFSVICLVIVYSALFATNYLKADCIKCVNKQIRSKILYGILDNLKSNQSALNFLTNDYKQLETKRFQTQLEMMSAICSLIISLSFSFIINWKISILFLFGTLIPMALTSAIQKPIRSAAKQWSSDNSKYTNQVNGFIKNIFTIQLYNSTKEFVKKNRKETNNLENSLFKMNCTNLEGNALVNLSGTIFSLLVPFVIGIVFVVQGKTTLGRFFAIFQLANSFVSPIIGLLNGFSSLSTTKHIAKEVKKLLENCNVKSKKEPQYTNIFEIKIRDLKLPHTKKCITQTIHSGDKVAIIGESGVGKTTLLNELLNEDKYKSGNIVIKSEGKDIKKNYKDLFSYVKQTPAIFPTDLKFNLTLGKGISTDQINKVCRGLNLDKVISEKGWNYLLNSNDDKLSGGQLQRISLARSILMNRPILLLDEINASLDKKNSKDVHKYLFNLNKTVIEVIHHYDIKDLEKYDIVINLNK